MRLRPEDRAPNAPSTGRADGRAASTVRGASLLFATALLGSGAVGGGGCSAPEANRPRTEDKARRLVPIPACVVPMPPRAPNSVAQRSLTEQQLWKLVFPSFDTEKKRLPERAPVCTGDALLDEKIFEGGTPLRGSWPYQTEEGDILVGAGGERLRLLWLRSHKFGDGTVGGALALTRINDDFAEVYAVGALRSRMGEKTRLGIERLGSEVVPTVTDDGCLGRTPTDSCETVLHVFVGRKGVLRPVADVTLERVVFAQGTEPGIFGRIEYHLTAAPQFSAGGLKLLEQVKVQDDKQKPLRKAELERMLVIDGDRPMKASDPPLWPRLAPSASAVATPPPAPSSSASAK